MDDAALVRQALAGQREAYAALARRWAGRLLALCRARVGRADAAEGLAQEALLRGLQSLEVLPDPERFGPWLVGIASGVCRDWLESHPAAPSSDGDPAGRLRAALEALPEEDRTVLLLRGTRDMSYAELAHVLDLTPAAVGARLARARALLRERLANPPR